MRHEALAVLPRVLEEHGIRRPVLVGHSDGASISLIHASRHPVLALALEAPHVFVEPLTVSSIAALRERYEEVREKLERLHGPGTDATFEGWTGVWLRPEFHAWDIRDLLPSVTCPVLAIQGEEDRFGTVRHVEAIASLVSGPVETVLLPGCGHSPHFQRREETLAAMTAFLRVLLS